MQEPLSGVNGEVIRWARELHNQSPAEAAREIAVPLARYLNWESGKKHPNYAELKRISEALGKPSAVFFFPEPPQIPKPTGDLPESIVKRLSKDTIQHFEQARAYQLHLQTLDPQQTGLFSHRDRFPDSIPDLCRFLRRQLDFPVSAQKAIRNPGTIFEILREKLYDRGVYVFKDSYQEDSISGICLNDDVFPVIMINDALSFERQIYTLFHALYHLIRNTSGVVALEDSLAQEKRLCSAFANTFLVPAEDLMTEIGQSCTVCGECIATLSTLYSVCQETILYQLYAINRMSDSEYAQYKEAFHADPIPAGPKRTVCSGGNWCSVKLRYLGRKYMREVFEQYAIHQIDCIEASQMLDCKVDQLDALEHHVFQLQAF